MPGLTATSTSFKLADVKVTIPGRRIVFRSRETHLLLFSWQAVAHLGTWGFLRRSMTRRSARKGE